MIDTMAHDHVSLLLMLQVRHFKSFSRTLSTVNEHFLKLDDRLAMNVWPSFQQKFSSCSILRDTVYFHHQSIFQSNHFQGWSLSHRSKHYIVVLHTACSIPRDTCIHYRHPTFQTNLYRGMQSVQNSSVHILVLCSSGNILNGMP